MTAKGTSGRPPAKVAWISCVGEKGGAEVLMLNALRHLDRQRFQPLVILLRPGPLELDLQAEGITVRVLKRHRLRNAFTVWRAIRQIRRMVREEGIDLVHSNGFRTHLYGALAARGCGIPEFWTVHTCEPLSPLNRVILRIPSSCVIANSRRTSEFFAAHRHSNEIIFPGIDLDRLLRGADRDDLAQRYAIPRHARWVSMVARMQRYKGHHFFLQAIADSQRSLLVLHGIIIGAALFGMETEYMDELRRRAAQLGISRCIHFTGFIPDADVAGFLRASELVIHPALDEDFGLAIAEAQALGTAVIAFDSPGPATIVVSGETGCLVPVGDQTALSQATASALAQPELVRRWGTAGAERSRRLFDCRPAARRLEALYQQCSDSHLDR